MNRSSFPVSFFLGQSKNALAQMVLVARNWFARHGDKAAK
jgi:hypothetical protein